MKRLIIFIISIVFIVLSCIPFAFAVTNNITTLNLPFNQPASDIPYVVAVYRNNSNGALSVNMWTFSDTYYLNSSLYGEADDSYVDYLLSYDSTTGRLHVSYIMHTSESVNITLFTQRYLWSTSSTIYRLYDCDRVTLGTNVTSYVPLSYTANPTNYSLVGCFYGNGVSLLAPDYFDNQYDIVFSGDIDNDLINQANDYLSTIDSSVYTIFLEVDTLNDKISVVNSQLDTIISILEDVYDVTTTAPTTNADVSAYEQAEGQLLDNAFGNLDSVSMPTIPFNSGTTGNAFLFISNYIEFFTSNSKIRSVIMIVLSLALVAFLLKILPHKGSSD